MECLSSLARSGPNLLSRAGGSNGSFRSTIASENLNLSYRLLPTLFSALLCTAANVKLVVVLVK